MCLVWYFFFEAIWKILKLCLFAVSPTEPYVSHNQLSAPPDPTRLPTWHFPQTFRHPPPNSKSAPQCAEWAESPLGSLFPHTCSPDRRGRWQAESKGSSCVCSLPISRLHLPINTFLINLCYHYRYHQLLSVFFVHLLSLACHAERHPPFSFRIWMRSKSNYFLSAYHLSLISPEEGDNNALLPLHSAVLALVSRSVFVLFRARQVPCQALCFQNISGKWTLGMEQNVYGKGVPGVSGLKENKGVIVWSVSKRKPLDLS